MILNLFRNDDINFIDSEISYFGTIPPYADFKFLGWTKDLTTEESPLGYESDLGDFFIPVFIKNFSIDPISDEVEREQEAIDNGKNCVILVYGSKNESYVMRFTSKELKYIDLSFFDDEDVFKSFFMEI